MSPEKNDSFFSRLSSYDFSLPEGLIAVSPSQKRDECRLMHLKRESKEIHHRIFSDISEILRPGTLLILNDTRVLKARIEAEKKSGAKAQLLFLKRLDDEGFEWEVLAKGRKIAAASELILPGGVNGLCKGVSSDGKLKRFRFSAPVNADYLQRHGRTPLPPYIEARRRQSGFQADAKVDDEYYQTVFSKGGESAAASTSALHFTDELLDRLKGNGVEVRCLTLNIGYGTFNPIEEEDLSKHKMHEESFIVPEESAEAIAKAKSESRKICACGTTVTRVLESEYDPESKRLKRTSGSTDIFIRPPYRYKCIDALITNFHTPRSSLLAMVSAFAGYDELMNAYSCAINEGYRFFSFGDAMIIE